MKKTPLLILLTAAVLACMWLLWKPNQPIVSEAVLPTIPLPATRPQVSPVPVTTVESSSSKPKPQAAASHHDWLEARFASLAITQSVDPVTGEPIGTIKVGAASGSLGETPPFYRLQLKTAKHPILLGEKDTRHHHVRRVDGVHTIGGEVALVPEVAVSYPRSASLGGFLFKRDDEEISQIGIIIPDVRVPAGDDPTTQWATSIRIGSHELSAEDLAKATPRPMPADTVLVMPTQQDPPPAMVRILWLVLDANGSFAVTHK